MPDPVRSHNCVSCGCELGARGFTQDPAVKVCFWCGEHFCPGCYEKHSEHDVEEEIRGSAEH